MSSASEINDSRESNVVSVALIIPFYNGSEYFDAAVESALNQTRPYDEIIVVNDGSSEKESEWLRLHSRNGLFRLVDKENGGQGSARNAGAFAAKSDFLCFLDQDDFLYPDHAEQLIRAMNSLRPPRGWVFGNFSTCDAMGNMLGHLSYPRATQPLTLIGFLSLDLFMLPSATIFCRKAFVSVGGFDTQFIGYEDDDLFVRLFMAGFLYSHLAEELYVWRMHGKQTSSTLKMCESRLRFVKKWVNINIADVQSKNWIILALFRRFIYTILADYYLSRNEEELRRRKEIAMEYQQLFHDKFSGILRFEVRILQAVIGYSPRMIGAFFLANPFTSKLLKTIAKLFR